MSEPGRTIWFAGDLSDPWARAIGRALPAGSARGDGAGAWPPAWPDDAPGPAGLVLHRALPTAADAQAIARLHAKLDRDLGWTPWTVLCVSAHARYAEVDRWSRLVDEVLPEATAPAIIARHALPPDLRPRRPAGPRGRVAVLAATHDLRHALADACRAGGYAAEPARDWHEVGPGVPALWDVPVLEPGWAGVLRARAALAPVVALLPFADRATVREAADAGAAAVLDLTADAADLLDALDALAPAALRADPAHPAPPPPRVFGAGVVEAIRPT